MKVLMVVVQHATQRELSGKAGGEEEEGLRIPAKPLCMQAARIWVGSLGCHFRRHTPPPVLTCHRHQACRAALACSAAHDLLS